MHDLQGTVALPSGRVDGRTDGGVDFFETFS